MNRIQTILEADPDGSLHLPVPEHLRHGKVKVTATLEAVEGIGGAEGRVRATAEMLEQRRQALIDLRKMGGLGGVIGDPVEWQRELREERPLPGREAQG